MRIQHNIMAMNAYRNYTNNVSAMKKNLEKLSSGYKINRAGDDAAGLAISEKMRAQITGLETAQKNAKDGISLVQTAEGALTEVHDMLNRMVELATQSANGTYDDTTDRNQMQKELDQLRSEIDRIADSSNFNGIKLLDGSLGLNSSAFEITTEYAKDATTVDGLFDLDNMPPAGDTKITNTILHTDSTDSQQGEFKIDVSQLYKAADGTTAAKIKVEIAGYTVTIAAADATTALDGTEIASQITAEFASGLVFTAGGGVISGGSTINTGAIYYSMQSNSQGVITFKATRVYTSASGYDSVTGTATTDNPISKKATDAAAAAASKFDVAVTNDTTAGTGELTGTENVGGVAITPFVKAQTGKLANTVLDVDVTKLKDGMTITLGDATVTVALGKDSANKNASNVLDLTKYEADELSANKVAIVDKIAVALNNGNGYFTVGQNTDGKLTLSEIGDASGGSGITGTQAEKEAKWEKLSTIDGIKSLFSVEEPAANAKTTINIKNANSIKEGDALTIDGTQYVFTKDTSKAAPSNTVYVDIKNAVSDLGSKLTGATVNGNKITLTAASADAKPIVALGRGLTLQIGDTADSYNQLNVTVNDTHCDSLGIDSSMISIADQTSAQAAVDKIKAAINYVSDVRGTLGATQNRLDHTINNLSVMTENIQDAESTIRDTDVAEEMMAYTKNNILIQSAQAMLAQANQVPQGVLQLLG